MAAASAAASLNLVIFVAGTPAAFNSLSVAITACEAKKIPCVNKLSETLSSIEKMPLLFLGHGSPMNAIEENSIEETLDSKETDNLDEDDLEIPAFLRRQKN